MIRTMYRGSGWPSDTDRNIKRGLYPRRIVECGDDGNLRRALWRWQMSLDVQSLQRNGGDIDKIDVAVESAVKTEIAQVGGDAVEVTRVVAHHSDGDAGLVCRC